jgi:hypothetical protein
MGGKRLTWCNFGYNLNSGGSDSNDCYFLVFEAVACIPASRVKQFPLEVRDSLNIWILPRTMLHVSISNLSIIQIRHVGAAILQDTTRIDEYVALVVERLVPMVDFEVPFSGGLVPNR